MSVFIRFAGVAAAAAIAFGGALAAPAVANEAPAPCAQQLAQVAKAEAAFERVAAVHAAHPNKGNTKAKKAQEQRLDKATERLASCAPPA